MEEVNGTKAFCSLESDNSFCTPLLPSLRKLRATSLRREAQLERTEWQAVPAPNSRVLIAKICFFSPRWLCMSVHNSKPKCLRHGDVSQATWREPKRGYTVDTHFLKVLEGGTGEKFFQEVSPETRPIQQIAYGMESVSISSSRARVRETMPASGRRR